jgi:hypothetical protein
VPFSSGAPKSFAAASCGSAAGDSNSPWGRACSTATAAAALLHRGRRSSAIALPGDCRNGRLAGLAVAQLRAPGFRAKEEGSVGERDQAAP